MFAEVILPLALPKRTYTYAIPDGCRSAVRPGIRVEVPFGKNKHYSALVAEVHNTTPDYPVKELIGVLDEATIVTREQLTLWDWIAAYYCCSQGEVMAAALPGYLKLGSETILVYQEAYGDDFSELSNDEYLIAEALLIQKEITIEDARKILGRHTVLPVVQQLIQQGVMYVKETLQEKYKPRKRSAVRLSPNLKNNPDRLKEAFESLKKHDKQTNLLLAFKALSKDKPFVLKKLLLEKADATDAVLKSLVKKGILEIYDQEVSRMGAYSDPEEDLQPLSPQQQRAVSEIRDHFAHQRVTLLHGVTGSGKTRVYAELIRQTVAEGGQVLYLLPEIALTTHLVSRLQRLFGNDVAVYHSRINDQERVEIWKSAQHKPLILSARSGLFLPFGNLKLVVVDEEHDPSFKQFDPAPRYHARDAAIYLANLHQANVVLGTATPSLESYYNAQQGKYGYVAMPERFGGVAMPEIQTVDLKAAYQKKEMQGMFAPQLIEALKTTLARNEQVILFQNRRGYSPILECQVCGWSAMCKHCEVSLTYHKHNHRLRCHYCGYQEPSPPNCPACGSAKINLLGFGTEKIEDDLKIYLPEARIARLDMDTAGSKNNLNTILQDFEDHRIDILVGTQMVTKGLDFENVGLVGVLRADQSLKFPDFRSGERTFQLLTQVAGRAGRKNKRGAVIIQAIHPKHPVLQDMFDGNFPGFAARELKEREDFRYPPFLRLIRITLEHKEADTARKAAQFVAASLRRILGQRVLGPVPPVIPRLRGLFGQSILLKLEKSTPLLHDSKSLLRQLHDQLNATPEWRQVRMTLDVDPY